MLWRVCQCPDERNVLLLLLLLVLFLLLLVLLVAMLPGYVRAGASHHPSPPAHSPPDTRY